MEAPPAPSFAPEKLRLDSAGVIFRPSTNLPGFFRNLNSLDNIVLPHKVRTYISYPFSHKSIDILKYFLKLYLSSKLLLIAFC